MFRLSIVFAAAAGAFLVPDVQPADACGVKMTVKGAKVRQARANLESRRARSTGDRTPTQVGPIVTSSRGSGPIASGGGDTTPTPEKRVEATPSKPVAAAKRPKRPKPVEKTPDPVTEPTPATEPAPVDSTPADTTPAEAKFNKEYSFENGSAGIGSDQRQMLRETAAWMKANPKKRLIVEGHASRVGAADTNQAISEARATAVVDFLVAEGVPAKRMTKKGMGAKKPAYKPASDPQNRRVVLIAK